MDIRIKETLYLHNNDTDYIVRANTMGVEKNKIVYFYDVTRTISVGFPRVFCTENPQMFQVSRTLSDREISITDAVKAIKELRLPPGISQLIEDKLNTL